jgi:carbon-monoxide dehydrogenase medium subunit
MDEFHVGPYMTAVGDGELLTEVRIPCARRGSAHEKVERRAGDWAIAAASAAVWIDGGTDRRRAGIALSAVGLTTIHLSRAESCCAARRRRRSSSRRPARSPRRTAPGADGRGPVDYKRHLAGAHPARPAPRRRAPYTSGGLTMNVSMTSTASRSPARSSRAAARPLHPRDTSA